ncbi:MAG TPA: hypothetical protein EYQ25_01900 [Planctomycetes bacterium]|nr:hypothetical protein [Planctomycetota bacterium]
MTDSGSFSSFEPLGKDYSSDDEGWSHLSSGPESPLPAPRSTPETDRIPGPLAEASLRERLCRWDELPPKELAQLERDPATAAALARLRELETQLEDNTPADPPCPVPEELYSFGRGPGATPLDPNRRYQIREHIQHCAPCASCVKTLRHAPPPPLVFEPLEVTAVGGVRRVLNPLREKRWRRESTSMLRWTPLAAAAALLLLIGGNLGSDTTTGDWPGHPVMRGEESATLLFPRGPVLGGALGAWASDPTFELTSLGPDESYHIELFRTDGSAFDEGLLVWQGESSNPTIQLRQPLTPAHYTWHASLLRDGLTQRLGSMDFEVRQDQGLVRALMLRRGVAALAYLHKEGYLTDARQAARDEPDSPERNAYLHTLPRQ